MSTLRSRRSSRTLALAAALLLFGGCALIDRMSGVAETKQLQESGVAGSATILAVWDTGITVNDDPVIAMRVEVARPDGSVYSAVIPKTLISRLDVPRFQPGSTVPVRIDPQDPLHMAVDAYHYR
jgi:energy-converting hydrogenase Eha subunit H